MSDATVTAAPAAQVTTSGPTPTWWRTEDWMAVFLGFIVLVTVLTLFHWKVMDLRNVVPTFRWTTDSQIAALTPAGSTRWIRSPAMPKPGGNKTSWISARA